LVFGMSGVPVPPAAPSEPPASGTLVFGSSALQSLVPPAVKPVLGPGSETLVFGIPNDTPLPLGTPVSGTLVYGGQEPTPPPVAAAPLGTGTLAFGSAAELEPLAEPPDAASSPPATLEFNFDDMVKQASMPTAPPLPSPSVPQDPGEDDGPKTAWDRSNPRIDI